MDASMVENHLYLGPEAEREAPKCEIPASQSRAVDILASKTALPFKISSQSHYMKTPKELKEALKKDIIEDDNSENQRPLDRIYYENNWPFARSLLVRKFVKGTFTNPLDIKTRVLEDANLAKFQAFLNDANRREGLDFSYFGMGSTLDVRLLAAPDRLLYYFGFDWMAIDYSGQSDSSFKKLHVHTKRSQGQPCIVRRRTCIACIFKTKNTDRLWKSPVFPDSWAATSPLNHRRTLIFFNELHSATDTLPFYEWLSPEKSSMWNVTDEAHLSYDDEVTAMTFMHTITVSVWKQVVHEWKNVVDQCSEHIRTKEELAIDTRLSITDLELLANQTWNDNLSWFTLQKLLLAHQSSLQKSRIHLLRLGGIVDLPLPSPPTSPPPDPETPSSEADTLAPLIADLAQLIDLVTNDFTRRSSAISDQVYNIINVKSAQAAQDYSESMGRISWISFIFFPLITISGMFGMNVDVLANDPSIKWFLYCGGAVYGACAGGGGCDAEFGGLEG